MNEKITAHPQKEEREKVLKEIRQLENRKKILENKQRLSLIHISLTLFEKGHHSNGAYSAAPGGWKR